MANWSTTSIKFYGKGEEIEELKKEIKKDITDDWLTPSYPDEYKDKEYFKVPVEIKAGYSSMDINEIIEDDGYFMLTGNGRWCGPHTYVKKLAEKYKVDLYYTDEESGCDFFNKITMSDGILVEEINTEYFSDESIQENGIDYYLEDYSWLFEEIYEENFEQDNKTLLSLFEKYGYGIKKLKEYYERNTETIAD